MPRCLGPLDLVVQPPIAASGPTRCIGSGPLLLPLVHRPCHAVARERIYGGEVWEAPEWRAPGARTLLQARRSDAITSSSGSCEL